MLKCSGGRLAEVYDLAMLDLDGVVYIGGEAVPGAAASIERARAAGLRVAFVTNNAARPPAAVASHLQDLGVPAEAGDVVTSAQAAARVLRDRFGEGARIAALGADGLLEALRAEGLVPVAADADAAAAVTGYGPDVVWRDVMRLASRIREGLPWVASNTDGSLPTPYGVAPGHGALVGLISRFADVEPIVAGKPAPPLLQETIRRVGGRRPLMVGDRIDTDIEGGIAVGVDTLLVMTGVTGLAELVSVPAPDRPTFIAADLGGLLEPHPEVTVDGAAVRSGGWTASVREGSLRIEGDGEASDWWRAVASAGWRHLDECGTSASVDGLVPPHADRAARR